MGSTRKRGDVRVPIPLLSDESSGDAPLAKAESKRQASIEARVDKCHKLLDDALDRVQNAWSRVEEGAAIDDARAEIVKATAALIGLKRELSHLRPKR